MNYRNLQDMTLEQICEEAEELLTPKAYEHVHGGDTRHTINNDEEKRLKEICRHLKSLSNENPRIKDILEECPFC